MFEVIVFCRDVLGPMSSTMGPMGPMGGGGMGEGITERKYLEIAFTRQDPRGVGGLTVSGIEDEKKKDVSLKFDKISTTA